MKFAAACTLICLSAGSSHSQTPGPPVQCALEEAKLLPATGFAKEAFGRSVAVSGDTVVVGSNPPNPFTVPPGPKIGAAYVFVRDSSGQWSQQAGLDPPGGQNGDMFGYAVAISGDTIVVGSPEANGFNFDQGAAYVYVREGTVWSFQQKLQIALAQEAHFGWSVAVDGETLAIGSPEDLRFGCPCPGSVYVYGRSGAIWSFVQQLTGSNGQPNYAFGQSVSISDGRILIGDSGSAYVFERPGSSWMEMAYIPVPNPGALGFGRAVSLSGDTAVIGARLDGCAGQYAGAAYVFVDQGTTWSLEAKLVGHDTTDGDRFGTSVFVSEDCVLIGSPIHDEKGIVASGAAYLFLRAGVSWSERLKLTSGDPAFNDSFGHALFLGAEFAVVGVPGDDDQGMDSGSAYVFDLLPEPLVYCTAKPNSCGTLPSISYTGAPSASDQGVFLVTASSTRAQKSGLLLYTDAGRGSQPFSGGTLCLASAPLKRSVAVADTTGTPGQCNGTLSIDMNAFATGALGGNPMPSLTVPGTQINCQFWARDTLANGALLTDALEYFVCE